MMYRLLYDSLLPDVTQAFPSSFQCLPYQDNLELEALLQEDDILLCRSTLTLPTVSMHHHKPQIVATASSGSDNLDKKALANLGIDYCDALGCNKESVADYALSCLAILKDALGKLPSPIGIFGVGAVGETVARRFAALGIELVLFDPPKASHDRHFQSANETDLLTCPVIFLHANLHYEASHGTYHWFNAKRLGLLSDGAVLVNLARGALVDEQALLAETPRLAFISDVFENEPNISATMVEKALLCTPHIAGHALEGKREAIRILSQKIHAKLGLPAPKFLPFQTVAFNSSKPHRHWEDWCLEAYDPRVESSILKACKPENLADTFVQLRKAHQFRHNFSCLAGFTELQNAMSQ